LEDLVLVCRERARQFSGATWNVVTSEQVRKFRKLLRPSQLIENATQVDKKVDKGCCH